MSIRSLQFQRYSALMYCGFQKPLKNPLKTPVEVTNTRKKRQKKVTPIKDETPIEPSEEALAPESEDPDPPDDSTDAGDQVDEAAKPGRPRRGETRNPSVRFFDRWNATPNIEENGQYWIFRQEPITDRVAQGKDRYIRIYTEPCDEDKILKDPACGSGVYKILFKLRRGSGSAFDLVGTLDRMAIENVLYPPCIEPGDWLDDPRNKRWHWAKKIYDDRMRKEEAKNAPPPVGPSLAEIELLIDRKMPRTNAEPETVLQAVKAGFEQATAATPKGNDVQVQILMDELRAQREQSGKLQERIFNMLTEKATAPPPPAPPPPPTLEQEMERVAKVVESVEKIRPARSSKAPEPEHPGWKLLEHLIDGLTPVAATFLTKLQQGPPRPRPAAPGAAAVIDAQPAPNSGEQPVQQLMIPEELAANIRTVLTLFEKGWTGEQFADWLYALDETALSKLRAFGAEEGKTPVDKILEVFKQIPQVWARIAGMPDGEKRMRAFIASALAWTPEQEPADETPETPIQ